MNSDGNNINNIADANNANTIINPDVSTPAQAESSFGANNVSAAGNNPMPNIENVTIKKEEQKPTPTMSKPSVSAPTDPKKKKAFDKLVLKAKKEEAKRIKEQEKLQRDTEAKEKLRLKKEHEENLKFEKREQAKQAKLEQLKKSGKAVTLNDKLKNVYNVLTKNQNEELELEAKKAVLEEQFKNSAETSVRFSKPILFNYTAKTPDGKIVNNSIEALSRLDVHSFLEQEGYEVYDISAAKVIQQPTIFGAEVMKRNRLIFYLSQLSAYLKSGIALADSVKILEEQAKKTFEKKTWNAVYYDLSMGDVLSTALDKRGKVFPKLLINMIKTAEMTGNLIDTLDDMVEYYTEQETIHKQMISAMIYPIVVSIFAAVVVTFILMWVVPQFVSIYDDLGSDLPPITKIVMGISHFLTNYLLWIAGGLAILLILYLYLFNTSKSFKKAMQEFSMRIPIFGKIIIYNEVTMFTKTFANLINHNVFITDSMDVLNKITDNEVYKKLIHDTAINLTKGETISKAFKDHWAFPNIAYQMLITGEKTGRLGPMMERVSNYYQEQHKNLVDQMKSLIEPVLIVSLAVIVGGILLSVIIPMYGMYDALG